MGMFGRIRGNVTVNAADLVYTSYILPILDYCDSLELLR